MLCILGYLVCVIVAFKVIKIKPSPVSIAIATLVGVLMVGGLLIGWKIAAPMSGQMIVNRKVIQLLSNQDSKEVITKIHVASEQPVKKGDPLYETDPTPNQYIVDQSTAQLAASEQNIKQLEAGVEVAAAAVEAAQASEAYKKSQLDTGLTTQKLDAAAVAELEVEVLRQNYAAARAGVEKALASQKEADYALTTAKDAIKATEAQLATAKLNLEQNVVRAPTDGYITNWQAVEGTMTTTVITSAQGTFMDTSNAVIAAVFPQNLLKNVAVDDEVEIAFKSFPGKIATGKVDAILEYSGEGQLEPSGVIPVVATLHPDGYLVVRIKLDDKELEKQLPLGGAGTVAIYTKALKPLHVITKITVRIKMWTNYLPI
jgi:multidrug resistance efflux pump